MTNREKIELIKELSLLLEKENITKDEYESQKNQILNPRKDLWSPFGQLSFSLRSISPQLVVLILILIFYIPIKNLVRNASEIGFGDVFAVKVEQALRIGNPDLARSVKSLSREELITLLDSAQGDYRLSYVDSGNREVSLVPRFDYYVALQERGLFESEDNLASIKRLIESKTSLREDRISDSVLGSFNQKYYSLNDFSTEELAQIQMTSVRLSENGKQVYVLIINVASEEITNLR